MKWVRVSDKKPKIDSVVRKIGYTDVMDYGDFMPLLKRNPYIALEYEWLDEERTFTLQDMIAIYEYGQSDCGEFGNVIGHEQYFKEKFNIDITQ